MKQALRELISRHDEIVLPVSQVEASLGTKVVVVPRFIGIDPESQLARTLFEADYLGKSILFRPEFEGTDLRL